MDNQTVLEYGLGTFIAPIALQPGCNLVSVSEESTMLPNLSVGDQIWGWNAEKKNFSIHRQVHHLIQ